MANIKITDLTAYTDPLNTDVLPIVDVTSDTTKKVSIADLLKNASAGTAAAPGIAFDGDPNTGIYSPGADQLAISTGGNGRLFVDSSGRVGIGGTSDFAEFQIAGSAPSLYLKPAADTETSEVAFRNAANSQTRGFVLYNHSDESLQFRVNLSERLRITSDGKLGVGISNPSTRLHAVGPNANGNFGVIETTGMFSAGGNQQLRLCVDETNKASALQSTESGVADRALLLNPKGGNVGIGTTSPSNKVEVRDSSDVTLQVVKTGIGAIKIGVDSDNFIDSINQTLTFRYGGSEKARLDQSGRLLVGTSSADNDYYISSVAYTPGIQFKGSGYNPSLALNRTDGGAFVFVANSQNVTTGGRAFGGMSFNGFDGANLLAGARIAAEADGTTGTGDMPGRLIFSTTSDGASSPTERMRIDSSGRVGIGTQNPGRALEVRSGTDDVVINAVSSDLGAFVSFEDNGTTSDTHVRVGCVGNDLRFDAGNSEKARIDSSGRLLVGKSSARSNVAGVAPGIQLEGANNNTPRSFGQIYGQSDAAGPLFLFAKHRSDSIGGQTIVSSSDELGQIQFTGSDGHNFVTGAVIKGEVDGTPGANDMPGRLVFSTTADGSSSPTERMRITSGGQIRTTSPSNTTIFYTNSQGASGSGFSFFFARSGNDTDTEFNLQGDGNGYCDGAWTGGGADYAEYFEWSDSNPNSEDRRGISVVLDGDKIREAQSGEDPVGVISGNPSMVGDSAWNKWSGKYLRDEYGTYVLDTNGARQLNPAYDPDAEYIPREQRPEWDCVGLMGKLRIRKGQVTGSRWIKMRDISDSVEEWLVR